MNTIKFKTDKSELSSRKDLYVDKEYFNQPLLYQIKGAVNLLKAIIKNLFN